jgi:hypothetical protein
MSVTESNSTDKRPGIWKRQFSQPITTPQLVFDIIFGVALPLLCIGCDLVYGFGLFNPRGLLSGYLWEYNMYCYFEIGIGVIAMTHYLCFHRPSAVLAGILFAGAIFSLLIGILLLPLSIIGLLLVIGIFGFTPLVSAFVYFRNARRCRAQVCELSSRSRATAITFVTTATVLIIPAIPEIYANRIIDQLVVSGP